MHMKTILCFGDSNTWGYDPASITATHARRHGIQQRWTGVLARELGTSYRVIEEGQNGRTTIHDDPFNAARNGRDYLPACLESHKPIDLVVLMLGTNDLKSCFNLPPGEIAGGAAILARMILSSEAGPDNKAPGLLLICPPKLGAMPHLPDLEAKFPHGIQRSEQFPRCYSAVAAAIGCAYLDSQEIVQTSLEDGLHLDISQHAKLGLAIAAKIRGI
jgi:lysophospholipase L1-like esterase